MAYIGKQPTIGNFVKLDSITTSATATYNLLNGGVAYSPQSPNHCIVSLNGVIQSPTTSFTISGSTIVFASALTATDVIDFILVLGDVLNIGTPSDATVGFSKVTSNLITGATAETSIAGGDSVLIYDDSASALRKMTRTNFVSGLGGIFETQLLHVRDEKASNTQGGASSATTSHTRVLNTVVTNEITGASLASNQITLPSGTYFIISRSPSFMTTSHKIILYNTTDSANTVIGSSAYSDETYQGSTDTFIIGRFTIAAQKVFEIRHYTNSARVSNGLGVATNLAGAVEVYADVQIWKVA